MGQAAHAHHEDHGHGGGGTGHHHEPHPVSYYVKIWAILLGLLVLSIMGPMLGNKILTIFTAFGIAIIKALMVAAFFMHLNIEKKIVWYMLFGMLAMVGMFWVGTVADINRFQGSNWIKPVAMQYEQDFHTFPGTHEEGEEEEAAPAAEHKEGASAPAADKKDEKKAEAPKPEETPDPAHTLPVAEKPPQ